ncbi:MAG: hypothetical protein WCP14_04405 [bacterium]
MGSIISYKCGDCGYRNGFFSGVSGISLSYQTPYYCNKKNEIVIVRGDAKIDGWPGDCPICPDCGDHKLVRWDYKTCPKCFKSNKYEDEGMWD